MNRLVAACVQLNAARDYAPNIDAVRTLVREARGRGAALIATPEISAMFEPNRAAHLEKALPEDGHPFLDAVRALAQETGAFLLLGSMAVKLDAASLANRSFLVSPAGEIVARYDKIHMFDVDLPSGETYRESALYRPGEMAVVTDLPWCRLGMTICYDLRFPYLYRALAQAGAEILAIPSAFTVPTGRAHWHVLMRARAIETGCFVLAPAQWGEHADGRKTFGHSLIIAPWGEVLADAGEGVGVITAELDLEKVAEARRMVPSLRHDRRFAPPQA